MATDDWGIEPDGRNQWRVRVKRIEKRTGRERNRKATVSGSKADARRERERICADLESTVAARPRIRLHAFVASWLELRAERLKPSTRRRYAASAQHIIPELGDLYLDAIAPSDVAAYVAGRTRAKAQGNTVLNELRMLRTVAKDAVSDGYSARDWCDRVTAPKVRRYTRQRPNLLTGEQFARVLAHVGARWRGLVLFLATTGARWGEATALRWEDLDVVGGEAHVQRSNDHGTAVTPKTDASTRSLPLLPEVVAELGLKRATGLVFATRKGKMHRGSPLRKVLDDACAKAGVPRVTAHGLRRTFNNLARKETSREVLKSITGHTTDAMVAHYSMIAPGEKADAARAVARSLGVLQGGRPR